MHGICLYIQIRFESLDVKHFKDLAIKVALAFLSDFETALIKKIAATVGFSEMFANAEYLCSAMRWIRCCSVFIVKYFPKPLLLHIIIFIINPFHPMSVNYGTNRFYSV